MNDEPEEGSDPRTPLLDHCFDGAARADPEIGHILLETDWFGHVRTQEGFF